MHGDDVSSEGALLHRCDVPVGDPIGDGRLWATGHQGAGPPVGDEGELTAQVLFSSRAVGDWGDV